MRESGTSRAQQRKLVPPIENHNNSEEKTGDEPKIQKRADLQEMIKGCKSRVVSGVSKQASVILNRS